MKRHFILLLVTGLLYINGQAQTSFINPEQTIFAYGGIINNKFVQYIIDLTKKQNPKVCYVPTASVLSWPEEVPVQFVGFKTA